MIGHAQKILSILIVFAVIVSCGSFQTQSEPAAVPEIRPGILAGYLKPEALPNSLVLLPPPPAQGSAAFALDEEVSRKCLALRGTPRWELATEDAFTFENPISTAKYEAVVAGLDKVVALAKKYKIKTAFGTDLLFDAKLAAKEGKFLTKLKKWYTPYEALKMATSTNAEFSKCAVRETPTRASSVW